MYLRRRSVNPPSGKWDIKAFHRRHSFNDASLSVSWLPFRNRDASIGFPRQRLQRLLSSGVRNVHKYLRVRARSREIAHPKPDVGESRFQRHAPEPIPYHHIAIHLLVHSEKALKSPLMASQSRLREAATAWQNRSAALPIVPFAVVSTGSQISRTPAKSIAQRCTHALQSRKVCTRS
jgi:hypothetical protein